MVKLVPAAIPEVLTVEPVVFQDARGIFMETWHAEKFRAAGLDVQFVQDNQSRSVRGTLRGLHYQLHQPQGKLVWVVRGEVFDVAVDLRRSSPTFGRWVGVVLSDGNRRQIWVPPGFAHGFYVRSATADVAYKCTAPYRAEYDRALRWNDPTIGIDWPLAAGAPLLSAKDEAAPLLRDAEVFA